MPRGAVFLDRDGTMIEEMGYINHLDRLHVFPWTALAVRRLNSAGIPAIVVTNQGGVAMGYFPEQLVRDIHDRLRVELARQDAHVDGIYYCPHHPGGTVSAYRRECDCRKPGIGLLRRAAEEHALDLRSSYVIGDRYRDVETAAAAGARGILVLSGYGRGECEFQRAAWPTMPEYIAENLSEAVDWVLEHSAPPPEAIRRLN
jgi:D-glycero-D-manno-heptose 1,7-bisphosphate phosphatase